MVNFISKWICKHKSKIEERNLKCNSYIERIESAISSVSSMFESNMEFAEPTLAVEWLKKNAGLMGEIKSISGLCKAKNYKKLVALQRELLNWEKNIQQRVVTHNESVALMKLPKAYELIGDVEGRKLDQQQMCCVVKEVHNHLVIAGAGTGKTTTIVGKIKYLLKTQKYSAKDFLVLSFTNASATEMRERIKNEVGEYIEASTFHKLGKNIIEAAEGVSPRISALNMLEFIKNQLKINMNSKEYLQWLNTYLLYNRVVGKSEFEFENEGEYEEYKKMNPPTTLKGETVKSYGEMDIANFLLQNGVDYIYENPYEKDTRTGGYGQYKPDFYLPEYHIYIEYFGIDRKGQVPPYFKGTAEKTAAERYQESMNWKRELHKANNTIMIECYAYEKWEGVLLEKLGERLKEKEVKFLPKSEDALWGALVKENNAVVDGVVELFQTVINLIKSNGYSFDIVRQKNRGSNKSSNALLLDLIEPIYKAYSDYLAEHDEIDFNDMINRATQYVREGKYVNPYKYVIVDEYQDIAKARFLLLEALRKSADYNLFCVGDDWQSIYRFAGSDISFILDFEKYWGAGEISKIETTYRFSQSLINVSGGFIMRNPKQIKKSIKGNSYHQGFALGEIKGYADKFAVEFMCKKLDDLPKDSTVFFIGRYRFDIKIVDSNVDLDYRYDNREGQVQVRYRKRPDLKISFLSAHKSKGLQADYVFILNNRKDRMGFPSKMQDAPILELLLDNSDVYPFGEERRLFYVALTRAKKKVYLLTVDEKESEFALELRNRYKKELSEERYTCPLCGGRLLKKMGRYGDFYGCSNYATKGCEYTRRIETK